MKFVHIADMHFDSPFIALADKGNLGDQRRLEQRNAFKKVIEYIKEKRVEYLFIAGDLYEHEYVRSTTIEYINKYHDLLKPNAVMTDISSVKDCIIACANQYENLNFVGSHPMAGTEKSSYLSSVKGLFNNADILIVPGKYSSLDGIK